MQQSVHDEGVGVPIIKEYYRASQLAVMVIGGPNNRSQQIATGLNKLD